MAAIKFRGDSQAIAQLETITIGGTWLANDTATVTINGKDVTFTVVSGSTAVSDVHAGLLAALQASTVSEFSEITWGGTSPDITGTGDSSGTPFTASVSKSSTSGTISTTTTTAATGPSHLTAENVTGGVLPGAADDFYFEHSTADLLYALGALSGTLTSVVIDSSYNGNIGLPPVNSSGYYEYRNPRYLDVDASSIIIGEGEGDGSGRIMIDSGSVQTSLTVKNSASSSDDYHAVRWKGTNASNTVYVTGGSLDVAPDPGESATIATLTVVGTGVCRTSRNCTITTVIAGGSAQLEMTTGANVTTLTVHEGATVTIEGTHNITTANVFGTLRMDGSGTITTVNGGPNGTLNCSDNDTGLTITDANLAPGFSINDPQNRITWTNPYDCQGGKAQDVNHVTGGGAKVRVTY